MFLIILVVMVVMVAITIMLPQLSGLATYTNNPDYIAKQRERKEAKNKSRPSQKFSGQQQQNAFTYAAPDADIEGDDQAVSSKSSAFKGVRSTLNKLAHPQLTESDIPIKLELVGENELKRRARRREEEPKKINADPNNFDYDIDEFIDEENRKEVLESQQDAQRRYGMSDV